MINDFFRVCHNGMPVADIVPISEVHINPLVMHAEISNISILYDPIAPLERDEWPME